MSTDILFFVNSFSCEQSFLCPFSSCIMIFNCLAECFAFGIAPKGPKGLGCLNAPRRQPGRRTSGTRSGSMLFPLYSGILLYWSCTTRLLSSKCSKSSIRTYCRRWCLLLIIFTAWGGLQMAINKALDYFLCGY